MTRFSYSEYLSQFRNGENRANSSLGKSPSSILRCAGRRWQQDGTAAESIEDVDPVVCAIRNGDVTAVNELAVASPLSLMKGNHEGWIPLHEAAYCGQAECIKALLRAQPGLVDKRTLQEQTALLLAVSCDHLSCVQCLLQAGADPDISSKNKDTPLYKACERENVDMVSLLLSSGATVNQRCHQGWTALHEAACRNNTDICELLVRAGATVNPPNTYCIAPLIAAAQQGRLEGLQYLIKRGADVNMHTCDGATALCEASKKGHRHVVAALLSSNADANKPTKAGLLPIHIAARFGHHEIVSLLVPVTSRPRIRHSGISPLHLSAQHSSDRVTAVLLKTGADVNATLSPSYSTQYADRRATALYFAVASGRTETAELLLKAGASVRLDPVSPLLLAVRQGCVRTVALLLESGADVNASTPAFPTSFPSAVVLCQNNLPLLKYLLDRGCNARACFSCAHGSRPQPTPHNPRSYMGGVNMGVLNDDMLSLTCIGTTPASRTQFCEWISSSPVCNMAGPVIDLLLDYVSNVSLCATLTEVLDSREDWQLVKRKTVSPRPLLHLCRLAVRGQVGVARLGSLNTLPLPGRLIQYLSLTTDSSLDIFSDS
ncbi:ankyrin repeat and SOCS box protein 2-like isoform X1 [Osmerus eperlanus]|uniref:ankyrin repeat and SOCS box protein 2-like isoform X1 n=2 Tax=Osmerus eperlanus TaxID=29151 RepID=UPI002E136E1C